MAIRGDGKLNWNSSPKPPQQTYTNGVKMRSQSAPPRGQDQVKRTGNPATKSVPTSRSSSPSISTQKEGPTRGRYFPDDRPKILQLNLNETPAKAGIARTEAPLGQISDRPSAPSTAEVLANARAVLDRVNRGDAGDTSQIIKKATLVANGRRLADLVATALETARFSVAHPGFESAKSLPGRVDGINKAIAIFTAGIDDPQLKSEFNKIGLSLNTTDSPRDLASKIGDRPNLIASFVNKIQIQQDLAGG
jgi:hypothetical protein